jgi:hypothetical protein
MAPRRWLWPCSDSHVLRLPAYQKPSLQSCLIHPEHPDQILIADSDPLDDVLHSAKRRRIESIAHAFLNGQPIYIPSATLKGPFPADRDLSLCHDPLSSPALQSVSPPPTVTADSFIRRRPEHNPPPKSNSPDPTFTPTKSRHSSPVVLENPVSRLQSSRPSARNKTSTHNLQSSVVSAPSTELPPLPKFVSINQPSARTRHAQNQLLSSTAQSRSFQSPRVRIPDTDFISPSPSPSKNDISPSKAAALRQRPAYSLNRLEKAPSSTHKLQSVKKNKRPAKRIYQAATAPDTSPFIYRKNAIQARNIPSPNIPKFTEPEVAPVEPEHVVVEPGTTTRQTPISPEKRHHVLFESSLNVPYAEPPHTSSAVEPERSPERPRHDPVPAINMSFGQESFGMNFDIVNHFNGSLPALSAGKEDTNANHRDQQLPTVTFDLNIERHAPDASKVRKREVEGQEPVLEHLDKGVILDDGARARANEEEEIMPGPVDKVSLGVTGDLLNDPMEDTVMDDIEAEQSSADEQPYFSTQAAMQDAHRALFDASSPLQPPEERFELPVGTPAKQVASPSPSPVHAITPFHQFNAEFTTDTQAPLPNTQALFDGFYSPIKLSAKKPRTTNRATFAPSVIIEDVDDTVSSILDISEDNTVHRSNEYDGDDAGRGNESLAELQGQTNPSPSGDLAKPTFSESPTNRSESPDMILSQKPPASTRESIGLSLPALQTESISLSEVFNYVSQRRGIDVDTLLSQATPTSSRSVTETGHQSARVSQGKSRSSLSKPGTARSRRPRSSMPKSLLKETVGQRRSTRISLSQPNPQMDGANDDDDETDVDIDGPPATQPHLTFADSGRSFALASFNIPDGSSTIPDPSLAFNHVQQNATPTSEKFAFTPGSVPQSTGPKSSFQDAQKQYSNLTDFDSTMPDLPQTFLPPVR